MTDRTLNREEIRTAFAEHDRHVTVNNFKVACLLGMVLMPAGAFLDRNMYPEAVWPFLQLRLISSLLIALFLGILLTPFGRKHYRFLGVALFLIPASFMAWMIYATDGATSPYYAGLNLVLLVLAFVLHWTFRESLWAVSLVLALYVVACLFHGPIPPEGDGPVRRTTSISSSSRASLSSPAAISTAGRATGSSRFASSWMRTSTCSRRATASSWNWTRSRAASSPTSAMNCARR